MNFNNYPMQILIVIAKGCRSNSPLPERAWMNLKPRGAGIPELRRAKDALIRAGLVLDSEPGSWCVQPTRLGYVAVAEWKANRQRLRRRPPMLSPMEGFAA